MKIMGTGSRSAITSTSPTPKEIYKELDDYITGIASKTNIVLISGMAEGWDEMIAACGKRNDIPYVCVLPTYDYTDYYWGPRSGYMAGSLLGMDRRRIAKEYIDHAFEVVHLEDLFGLPYYLRKTHDVKIAGPNYNINGQWVHASMARNQVMVDMCDTALVYAPTSSGTQDAVRRLNTAGKVWEAWPFVDHVIYDMA